MNIKATPYIYEIYKGLERYFGLFRREESIWALCRYVVGLLADIARKTCQGIADAVPGTLSQRLQELLTNTKWDHDRFNRAGVLYETVLFDAGYGGNQKLLDGLEERRKKFVGGIPCDFQVRIPEEMEKAAKNPPPHKQKTGRPRKKPYPGQLAPRRRVDDIAKSLPDSAWETITWREGNKGLLTRQFAFMRVHRTTNRRGTGSIGWLICERPLPGHEGDRKWYFSNLPEDTPHERLVRLAHRRHEIERYYQDANVSMLRSGKPGLQARV